MISRLSICVDVVVNYPRSCDTLIARFNIVYMFDEDVHENNLAIVAEIFLGESLVFVEA